jgi:hypothetical protein
MAENPSEKNKQNVIEKTCRVVMDIKIRISQITPENVAGYFTPDNTGDGLTWEWAERQNRLLSALIKDEGTLDKFLAGITRCALELLVDSKQAGGDQADKEEDRLFERIFPKLDNEDARYFREAKREGSFSENIYLIDKAFAIDWRGADITDLHVLKSRDCESKQQV